jgi:hypothetical protein
LEPFIVIEYPAYPLRFDTEVTAGKLHDVNKKLFLDGLGIEQLDGLITFPGHGLFGGWPSKQNFLFKYFLLL